MPRNYCLYSSSDEETYEPTRRHQSHSHHHRKHGHDRVPGIGREVQGIVHHTLPQHGKGIDGDHPLQQREKGIKADHVLVQNKGKDLGTAELIQGTFTQIKGITDRDHNHVQNPEAVAGF